MRMRRKVTRCVVNCMLIRISNVSRKRSRGMTRMRERVRGGKRCERVNWKAVHVRLWVQIQRWGRGQRCCRRRSLGAERLLTTAALKRCEGARWVEGFCRSTRKHDMSKCASCWQIKLPVNFPQFKEYLYLPSPYFFFILKSCSDEYISYEDHLRYAVVQ